MILPGELVIDNFAGGGGASTGIELGLDRHVDIAINHDPAAIDIHKVNHPETKHYCESVWDVDPIEACQGRPVGLAWFSPDCKHFSKAKGNRPVDKNIRGLAWVAIRWASLVPVRIMMLENVEEFMTWGACIEVSPGKYKPCPTRRGETFNGFIQALTTGVPVGSPVYKDIYHSLFQYNYDIKYKLKLYKAIKNGLGYQVDFKVLSACDYGVPTTRKRFFMVARNDGRSIKWPAKTHGKKGTGLKPYVTAADIIDWDIPVKSIFGRKKPLAEKTLARIAKGLDKFVFNCDEPFIVPEQCKFPFVTECANGSSQRNMAADEPLRTICAQVKGGHFALVTASITKESPTANDSSIEAPRSIPSYEEWIKKTEAYGGTKEEYQQVLSDDFMVTSHMVKMRGNNIGNGADEPLHTISAGGFHLGEVRAFLLKYYGTSFGESCKTPIGTVTTKDRFALVTVEGEQYQIIDIGLRMLEPHELFAAMGFPSEYLISHNSSGKKLSKASQVNRCGNAVCPPLAKAIVQSNVDCYECDNAA